MKALAIIVNIFVPGIGTLIIGKTGQGITQLLLFIFAAVLNFTIIGMVVGIPLGIAIWIWALVSVAASEPQPVHVIVTHKSEPQSTDKK